MLKKSASGVLASLRGSTYRSVRLASSLAAALLNGLFEHPQATHTYETLGLPNDCRGGVEVVGCWFGLDLVLEHDGGRATRLAVLVDLAIDDLHTL
jgi:hypothetical protein